MTATELISFFERDLKRLITEIELYKEEQQIWKVEKQIANSAGNLVLHLIGNLQTFIGKEIGNTDYVRNRELEFSQKNIPRTALIEQLENTIKTIQHTLSPLTEEDLKKDYPVLKFTEVSSTEYLLVHLSGHLTYHLGQINYHRRLISV
ncbi:MAG: DinB family protein [Chitinophagaceae bacterium]|nr:MAG: DinB family protein [Chitinophagaceae bacterium]